MLTRENLWNRAISFTIFLKREVVERVGAFDERLGLPSSSGEEIDYLIRSDAHPGESVEPRDLVHDLPEARGRRAGRRIRRAAGPAVVFGGGDRLPDQIGCAPGRICGTARSRSRSS